MAAPASSPIFGGTPIGERLWDFAPRNCRGHRHHRGVPVVGAENPPSRRTATPVFRGVRDDHEALEHGSRQGPIVDHATSTSPRHGPCMALVVAALAAATALLLRRRYPYPAVALAAAAAIIGRSPSTSRSPCRRPSPWSSTRSPSSEVGCRQPSESCPPPSC